MKGINGLFNTLPTLYTIWAAFTAKQMRYGRKVLLKGTVKESHWCQSTVIFVQIIYYYVGKEIKLETDPWLLGAGFNNVVSCRQPYSSTYRSHGKRRWEEAGIKASGMEKTPLCLCNCLSWRRPGFPWWESRQEWVVLGWGWRGWGPGNPSLCSLAMLDQIPVCLCFHFQFEK